MQRPSDHVQQYACSFHQSLKTYGAAARRLRCTSDGLYLPSAWLDSITLFSMPRCLLPFIICGTILCGYAESAVSLEPPTYGEKDLQSLRTFYRKPLASGVSDAADSMRRYRKVDYGALVVAATYKDRSALSTLMSFSPMDGEAGEEHSENLTLLLSGLGDDFFSSVLKSQPRAVRKSVLGDLWWDSDLKAHSPKTLGMTGNK